LDIGVLDIGVLDAGVFDAECVARRALDFDADAALAESTEDFFDLPRPLGQIPFFAFSRIFRHRPHPFTA
jgi:hypothetical protein